MLFILLLPLLVNAEWVEISQNHYRKESNPKHSNIHGKIAPNYDINNNHSTVEHQWSKGYVQRVPGVSIKRLEESELPVQNERDTFHRYELSTHKPELKTEITPWKSGNALIERLDHQRIPNSHHTTAANNHLQKLSDANTSKSILYNFNNNDQVIETVTLRQNLENPFKSTQNYFEESIGEISMQTNNNNQTISATNKKNIFKENEFNTGGNKREQTNTGKGKEKTKINTMETLTKFLKVVSQTINQNAQKSFNSKVRYLEGLKESLLGSIEEHINSAFPDDNEEQPRHRRASGADTHGHVDFPSSESALMTISFLTFAVFLIKLVLQVIHTYKTKTMMVTPAVVATVGRAATIIKKSTQN